jgi:hypothetical protein
MNTLLKWGIGIALVAYGVPKLLDLAADNPETLRKGAKKAREAREKAIEAAKAGAKKGVAFAKEKAGLKGLGKAHKTRLADDVLKMLPAKYKGCDIDPSALRRGIIAETKEHRDVTHGSIKKAAKIAAAHLCEDPNAY